MQKIISICIGIVCTSLIYGQKDGGDIDPVEIKIVKDYNVFIEEATKINTTISYQPQFKETSSKRKIEYHLPDRIEQFKFEPTSIEPIAYKSKDFFYNNTNFLKLGMGSILNPVLEWSHVKNTKSNQFKAYVLHHSAWASGDSFQKYSESKATFDFEKKIGRWDFIPRLNLNHKIYNFYGNISESVYQNESDRNYTNAEAMIQLNKLKTDLHSISIKNKLSGMVGLDNLNYLNTNTQKSNEQSLIYQLGLSYRFSEQTKINLEAGTNYYTLKWDTFTDKWLINANPYVEYKTKTLKLTGGLNFVQTLINSKDILYIFPKLESEIQVIPNMLNFYSSWDRKIDMNMMQSTFQMNPFALYDNQILPNTKIENRSAGIKGTIAGITFHSFFNQKLMKDAILFKNDDINPRYTTIIQEKNMTQNNVSLELSYMKNKLISTYIKGDLFLYEMDDNTKVPYNLPGQRLSFGVQLSPSQKLNLSMHTFVIGGVKSKINTNLVEKPMAFDLNLGGEYLISKNFYIFANLNNILNSQLNHQVGFQSYGMNAQGGFRIIYK